MIAPIFKYIYLFYVGLFQKAYLIKKKKSYQTMVSKIVVLYQKGFVVSVYLFFFIKIYYFFLTFFLFFHIFFIIKQKFMLIAI